MIIQDPKRNQAVNEMNFRDTFLILIEMARVDRIKRREKTIKRIFDRGIGSASFSISTGRVRDEETVSIWLLPVLWRVADLWTAELSEFLMVDHEPTENQTAPAIKMIPKMVSTCLVKKDSIFL